MNTLHEVVKRALEKFPLYSQEEEKDALVSIKLFNAYGAGTWYLTEYDPKSKIAFGYVTGLVVDEWGYVAIDELAALQFMGTVAAIEVDTSFMPNPFSRL